MSGSLKLRDVLGHVESLKSELRAARKDTEAQKSIVRGQAAEISALRAETTPVLRAVAAERLRQQAVEGWTKVNDDAHNHGQLALAAACYAVHGEMETKLLPTPVPVLWPWASHWWKPKTRRQDLIRAAALVVAEIERLDRIGPVKA